MDATPDLPWSRVAAFIRQHTHDVRNHLNSLELEASLMTDLINDPEAVECLGRIRAQIRTLAGNLRALSVKFQEPKVMVSPIAASDIFEIWKEQWSALSERPQIGWKNDLGGEMLTVDCASLAYVFTELLKNAKAFGTGDTMVASASVDGRDVLFELREPKRDPVDPSGWGTPFSSTRRHGYGLGLWEVDRTVRANNGRIKRRYLPDERALLTSLIFQAV